MAREAADFRPVEDLGAALGLLTRLPLGHMASRGARAAWAWPLAGAVVAGLAALAGWVAGVLGLTPALVAGLTLATGVAVTGALHEDGLADSADGLWGGWTRERRLEIMRDSRIGTYGVLALVFVTGLRWAALTAIVAAGALLGPLLAAAMLSRAAMAVLMARLPHARTDGLGHGTGRPPFPAVLLDRKSVV